MGEAPRRRGPLLVALVAAGVIGAAVLRLVWGSGAAPPSPTPAARDAPAPAPEEPPAPAPGSPGAPAGAAFAPPPEAPPPPRPLPDEGPDAAAWRASKVAFGLRELGAMAPYVKSGLDAARRDMDFCFREAAGAPAAARPQEGEGARPEGAILLLYLEAREGALDVVDSRVEYLGTVPPQVVECCREVLRGLEIPAFRAVPGRRYRLKYALE